MRRCTRTIFFLYFALLMYPFRSETPAAAEAESRQTTIGLNSIERIRDGVRDSDRTMQNGPQEAFHYESPRRSRKTKKWALAKK